MYNVIPTDYFAVLGNLLWLFSIMNCGLSDTGYCPVR